MRRRKLTYAELSEKTKVPLTRSLTRRDAGTLERRRLRLWGKRRRIYRGP